MSVRLSFEAGVLQDVLEPAERVIVRTALMPVLRCVLLKVEGEVLQIAASNLEQTVRARIQLGSVAPASVKAAIPARPLSQLLDMLPSDIHVDLEFQEHPPSLIVHTHSGKYQLGGEDPGEFPDLPEAQGEPIATLPAAILREAIESTLFAASKDEDNIQTRGMAGLRFELSPENSEAPLILVGTDAHRLVRFPVPEAEVRQSAEFTVPRRACQVLRQLLPSEDLPVQIYLQSPHVFFEYGPIQFHSQLISDPYPAYQSAIPSEPYPNFFAVDTDELLKIVKRLSLFTDKTSGMIALRARDGKVTLWTEEPELNNRAEEEVPTTYQGEPVELGFDVRFLTEMLNEFPADIIQIRLRDPVSPVVFEPGEPDSGQRKVLGLLMPMKVYSSPSATGESGAPSEHVSV